MVVVLVDVRLQNAFEVASVDDQQSVEALAADGADESLRVRFRRARWRAEDSGALAVEDLVASSPGRREAAMWAASGAASSPSWRSVPTICCPETC
jgi:hypothetical protein